MKRSRSLGEEMDLVKSENAIGQLYPVLRDAEGKVIDGFHRLDANPEWKSVTLENVRTEEERLIVSAHVNIGRREITKEEKIKIVNDLAEIYYQQGLRPDAKKHVERQDKSTIYITVNEIKQKIHEVLNGVISKSSVKNYLHSKYLNQQFSKDRKEYYETRRNNTSAWVLLKASHGKQLRKTYGNDFFEKLESELYEKALIEARRSMRNNRSLRKEIEDELRKGYDESIRLIILETEERVRTAIKAEMEYDLELMVVQ